jgi:hypothetical protein
MRSEQINATLDAARAESGIYLRKRLSRLWNWLRHTLGPPPAPRHA